jgi:nucleotide-binding universal stress UspA family protein
MDSRPIVVGVDGSPPSLAAVALGAEQAGALGRPLRLVHAFVWPHFRVPLDPPVGGPPDSGLRNQADRLVVEAVERARTAAPGVPVTGEVVTGFPTAVLIAESERATAVVVGDRGLGGFAGLLVGSVTVQLAAHARCPVLVARGRAEPSGPVVVGVDGSPGGAAAIGFAFEVAAVRRLELEAVHAWTHPTAREPGDMLPPVHDPELARGEEERLLAEALAGWREKYPDVPVRSRLVRAPSRRTLVEASRRAGLIVVGARGRGPFSGLVLGSVSQAVLHHAGCPVAIVPHADPARTR